MEIHSTGTVNININTSANKPDVTTSALKTVLALQKVGDQVKKDEVLLKVREIETPKELADFLETLTPRYYEYARKLTLPRTPVLNSEEKMKLIKAINIIREFACGHDMGEEKCIVS